MTNALPSATLTAVLLHLAASPSHTAPCDLTELALSTVPPKNSGGVCDLRFT